MATTTHFHAYQYIPCERLLYKAAQTAYVVFDTKLMGDLLQRIGDHTRVQNFLTGQVLNIIFTFLSFIIFGIVLFFYNHLIFGVLS